MLLAAKLVPHEVPAPPGCRALGVAGPRFCAFATPEKSILLVDVFTGARHEVPFRSQKFVGVHGVHVHLRLDEDNHLLYDIYAKTARAMPCWDLDNCSSTDSCGRFSVVIEHSPESPLAVMFTNTSPLKIVNTGLMSRYFDIMSADSHRAVLVSAEGYIEVSSTGSVKMFETKHVLKFDEGRPDLACRIIQTEDGTFAYKVHPDGPHRMICSHGSGTPNGRSCAQEASLMTYLGGVLFLNPMNAYTNCMKRSVVLDPDLLPNDGADARDLRYRTFSDLFEARWYNQRVLSVGAAGTFLRPLVHIDDCGLVADENSATRWNGQIEFIDRRNLYAYVFEVGILRGKVSWARAAFRIVLHRWGEASSHHFVAPARRLAWLARALGLEGVM